MLEKTGVWCGKQLKSLSNTEYERQPASQKTDLDAVVILQNGAIIEPQRQGVARLHMEAVTQAWENELMDRAKGGNLDAPGRGTERQLAS
jgi:hypothetical protein